MVDVPSWIRYGLAFWGIASLSGGMIMKAKPQAVERSKKRRNTFDQCLGRLPTSLPKEKQMQTPTCGRRGDNCFFESSIPTKMSCGRDDNSLCTVPRYASAREQTIEWQVTEYIAGVYCDSHLWNCTVLYGEAVDLQIGGSLRTVELHLLQLFVAGREDYPMTLRSDGRLLVGLKER